MSRALLYSAFIHIAVIALAISLSSRDIEKVSLDRNVRIRISHPLSRSELQKNQSQSTSRASKDQSIWPQLPEGTIEKIIPLKTGQQEITLDDLAEIHPEIPPISSPVGLYKRTGANTITSLDPLAGMESHLPDAEDNLSSQWSIFWEKGSQRAIISLPDFDDSILSSASERLDNVKVRIIVSAQGFVNTAEIEEPGTGNVSIDRYIHGKALDFIFEKVLDEEGEDIGVFHLVFGDPVKP